MSLLTSRISVCLYTHPSTHPHTNTHTRTHTQITDLSHNCDYILIPAYLEVKGGSNISMWQYVFWVNTGLGWVGGAAGLTGVLLFIILIIMVACSLPFVRRKGYFEVFYWTHNLFILWYILLILHATHFWIWFIVPGLLYVLERILRSKVIKLARYGRTYIQKGFLLPSRVSPV